MKEVTFTFKCNICNKSTNITKQLHDNWKETIPGKYVDIQLKCGHVLGTDNILSTSIKQKERNIS